MKGLKHLRQEWHVLQELSSDTNPYVQWEWVWHWWQLFGQSTNLLSHKLHIIVIRDEVAIRAIFPFVLTRAGKSPVEVRRLHLYGFTGGLTEIRAPLISPGYEKAVARTLLDYLSRRRSLYHWCVLEGIPAGGQFCHHLTAAAEKGKWVINPPLVDYLLPLPGDWDEFRHGLKRNIKQSLRHCYNSLKREGHEWSFEVVTEPHEMPAALDDFFRLHKARSDMPDTIPHPNYFRTSRRQAFLRQVANDLAAQHRFIVAQLHVDGQLVATRVMLSTGTCLYRYYSGFDPAWKRYSVMTTLMAECFKWAIQQGYRTVNLSTGTDVSKTRWSPEAREYISFRMPSPSLSGKVIFALRKYLPVEKIGLPEMQMPEQSAG